MLCASSGRRATVIVLIDREIERDGEAHFGLVDNPREHFGVFLGLPERPR
jgi:hypothetical protein